MRQPINNSSRVPAYLHGRKMAVSAFFCVEPSNIGEGRDGVDVFLLLLLRQKKQETSFFVSFLFEKKMNK